MIVEITQFNDYIEVKNNLLKKPEIQNSTRLGLLNLRKRYAFFTSKEVYSYFTMINECFDPLYGFVKFKISLSSHVRSIYTAQFSEVEMRLIEVYMAHTLNVHF